MYWTYICDSVLENILNNFVIYMYQKKLTIFLEAIQFHDNFCGFKYILINVPLCF